ncbi:MAG TPA: HlyD family secretion protein [Bryobacteraceae bacterium]|nr:HlyD family secretion protein [Bryobacteraceae bacterium]
MSTQLDTEPKQEPAERMADRSPVPKRSWFREHPRAVWVILVALLAASAGGYFIWRHYTVRESTDDAQIDGHILPVSARVAGHIVKVNAEENQYVAAGTVLVEIDPRDYQVALDRALADLAGAEATARAAHAAIPISSTTTRSQLSTARAGTEEAEAGVAVAQKEIAAANARLNAAQAGLRQSTANYTRVAQDLERYKQLIQRDEIPRQQYDAAVAAADAARATVDSSTASIREAEQGVAVAQSRAAQAKARVGQAESSVQAAGSGPQQVAVSRAEAGTAEAGVQQKRAAVAQARLNLEYTVIKAPVSGVVGKKNAEAGQNVQPGQPLLSVVPLEDLWVTANFKETQLRKMHPGQPAEISVDAYGGRKYKAHVESLAAATGATFSLLPPENATGNYVKVVQRLPVRIAIEKGQDPGHLLRPGMSVDATVLVE